MKQELMIVLIIFVLLFIKISSKECKNESLLRWANFLLLLNVLLGFFFAKEGLFFGNMFRTNGLIILQKNILNIGVLLISLQSYTWLQQHQHVVEFYILLLCSLLGMFFMVSSGNILMLYVGLELSTIPVAALANFDLTKKASSEAALKLIISSALASGLLLFGISLLYGTMGSLSLVSMPQFWHGDSLQMLAFILFFSGLAFKMSVVPFHFWTADVYEGAPVAVTAFLSVISKGAVAFVLVSVLSYSFRPLMQTWYHLLFILSVLTIIIGNLFALRQNNLKRFLAFSSIAQVGFVLIGVSAGTPQGSASVTYFILAYLFSNLAAFGVVSLVSAVANKETLEAYKAFYKTNPFLSWVLTIALFSLAGVPPTVGFFGKFFLLIAGAEKGTALAYTWLTIGALNLVVSFYYYLRVVKAIFMDSNDHPIQKIKIPFASTIAFIICLAGIILTGLCSGVYDFIFSLVRSIK